MSEEIIATLWEGETSMATAKDRLRHLVGDLRKTLSSIGNSVKPSMASAATLHTENAMITERIIDNAVFVFKTEFLLIFFGSVLIGCAKKMFFCIPPPFFSV